MEISRKFRVLEFEGFRGLEKKRNKVLPGFCAGFFLCKNYIRRKYETK